MSHWSPLGKWGLRREYSYLSVLLAVEPLRPEAATNGASAETAPQLTANSTNDCNFILTLRSTRQSTVNTGLPTSGTLERARTSWLRAMMTRCMWWRKSFLATASAGVIQALSDDF